MGETSLLPAKATNGKNISGFAIKLWQSELKGSTVEKAYGCVVLKRGKRG